MINENESSKIPLSEVILAAPVTKPDKVLCIGMNYVDHCEEQNKPIPEGNITFIEYLAIVLFNDARPERALSFGLGAGCMAVAVLLRNHHL